MKNYKIENKNYKIPESWYDITFRQFLQMREIESRVKEMEEIDYNIHYANILTSIPIDTLKSISLDELTRIMVDIYTFSKSEIPVLDDIIIKVNGITYVQDKNTEKFSIGQFIDLETSFKGSHYWDVANKITAIFLRKSDNSNFKDMIIRGKKILGRKITPEDYNIKKYDYKEALSDSEIFMDRLPLPYITSIMSFFLSFTIRLQQLTKDFTQEQVVQANQVPIIKKFKRNPLVTNTLKNGIGTE